MSTTDTIKIAKSVEREGYFKDFCHFNKDSKKCGGSLMNNSLRGLEKDKEHFNNSLLWPGPHVASL